MQNKNIPELEHGCNSWTLVCRKTGVAVVELFGRSSVEKVNTDKYEVLTTKQWLCRLAQQARVPDAPA